MRSDASSRISRVLALAVIALWPGLVTAQAVQDSSLTDRIGVRCVSLGDDPRVIGDMASNQTAPTEQLIAHGLADRAAAAAERCVAVLDLVRLGGMVHSDPDRQRVAAFVKDELTYYRERFDSSIRLANQTAGVTRVPGLAQAALSLSEKMRDLVRGFADSV
jgi:hypothetical protein